ncbi:MAG: hypothetical protein UU11_C0011G0031 [Parcubacteria group bacterium GW2011_GWF2_40_69]|nr:MAG: hypothetical protein UT25_C0003G0067 [Parcubacteria group bacterium GW2011_GWC1_39_12]KKR18950.1 MAG: hypothetical protein UT49_C0005G0017 [Parcubacteria group bacterium GW2011_GWF1_39_37]KKR35495.1 MAG: hypothetical protein UT68_C0003G0071 [Parcubacteria group bacterium GW2011_GWC2_40_10]KKR51984.1 MAG: hypothetical protein UT89_C0004G0069 [Parcubacteria group bacterium GW2011_GWE1_40_20]KKR68485.1 MAG: hypothetical protein UU11_C0011G0031 [Parcubacteria group bacterium GW2011_GWF2_40_
MPFKGIFVHRKFVDIKLNIGPPLAKVVGQRMYFKVVEKYFCLKTKYIFDMIFRVGKSQVFVNPNSCQGVRDDKIFFINTSGYVNLKQRFTTSINIIILKQCSSSENKIVKKSIKSKVHKGNAPAFTLQTLQLLTFDLKNYIFLYFVPFTIKFLIKLFLRV